MKLLDTTATLYHPAKAVELAAELNSSDPDWTYTAENPDGAKGPFSRIRIEDEDGKFVGHWRS